MQPSVRRQSQEEENPEAESAGGGIAKDATNPDGGVGGVPRGLSAPERSMASPRTETESW
jgi:hypothetical protein